MKDRKYITDFVPEVCKGIKNKLDQLEDEDAWLRKENARLREAITEFAKADKVLRRDYTEYCDKKVTHQTGFTRKTKLFTICGIRQ